MAKATSPAPKHIQWDPSWGRFAGRYSGDSGETEVVELDQRLVMIDPEGDNPETQQRLEPLGNGLFRLESDSGSGPVGEVVRFVEQNGHVVRMFTGESYKDRVGSR